MPLIFTSDKKRLLEHFRKDPVLFAYHIGDLDEFHFEHCQWAATYGLSPRIDDCILVYRDLAAPTVLAFGVSEKFPHLLREMIPLLPESFHCHFQSRSKVILTESFEFEDLGSHCKMKLVDFRADDSGRWAEEIQRLDTSHEAALLELYQAAYPGNYFVTRMLQTGKYFGCVVDGRIVAVAGVHVHSNEFNIGVLGNITTHPDFRGKGIGSAVTSRVAAELVSEGKSVCLNVQDGNAPAIACYEKLGFEIKHRYNEGFFRRG